jgi:hypothetical protein
LGESVKCKSLKSIQKLKVPEKPDISGFLDGFQKAFVGTLKIGYPAYKLKIKIRSRTCIHALPRKLYLQTIPPCIGGLRRHHVSRGPESHLLAEVSSDAATCPLAPDLASLMR